MSPPKPRRFLWLFPLAIYAIFLWRSLYSMKSFPLWVLDWIVPTVGLGLWLGLRWRRREQWPRTALDWPLLGWLTAAALATAFSMNVRVSLRATWEMFILALLLWLLVDAIRRGWAPALWRALYFVAAVVCLIGAFELLAWYFGWPLVPAFQQSWLAIGGLANPIPPVLHRLGLPLANITALSGFVALLIPPAMTIMLTTQDRDARIGMLLWLIAAGGVAILSLSRGGFLALGVSIPLLALAGLRSPQFLRWWSGLPAAVSRALLLVAALAVLAAIAGGFMITTRLATHGSGDAVRLDLWRSAVEIFRDSPLAGVGPAAYGTALRTYRDPLLARDHLTAAHNAYLNVGAEMGILGLLAGAWLLVALALAWWRRWQSETPGTAGWWRVVGVGTALAGLAAQSLVDTFVESAILLPAAFFVAIILAPQPKGAQVPSRARRWPWAVAMALLLLGALGMAWDTSGLADFSRSIARAREGEVAEALAPSEQAREKDPWMPLYDCYAGFLHGQQAAEGDEEALALGLQRYKVCLDATPAPGWIDQLNNAALLWEAGKKAEARELIEAATDQMPLEWMPWLNRGLWAEMSGDREDAIQAYGWVLSLDPELAGSPFWSQGERTVWWDEILATGQRVRAEHLGHPVSWRWQVMVAAGQWDEAVQELETWLANEPQDAEAMAWLGEALVALGRAEEALVWLDRALVQDPDRARTFTVRGEAALALERYEEAEQDLHTALFLEPDQRTQLALARLALETAGQEAALKRYARALRPLVLRQGSDQVVYRRMSWTVPLPQVARIGYRHDEEAALEWGALLEVQGDLETARRVYSAALLLDQFQEQVRSRLERIR